MSSFCASVFGPPLLDAGFSDGAFAPPLLAAGFSDGGLLAAACLVLGSVGAGLAPSTADAGFDSVIPSDCCAADCRTDVLFYAAYAASFLSCMAECLASILY